MKKLRTILKHTWKKGESIISTFIISFIVFVLASFFEGCNTKYNNDTFLLSDYTYLQLPTIEDRKLSPLLGNPIISFGLFINNMNDKKMVIRNNPPFFAKTGLKSSWYVLSCGKLYKAHILYSQIEVAPHSKDSSTNVINIFYDSIFPNKTPVTLNHDSLKIKATEIAKNGIIIYVPNQADYLDIDTNKCFFPKKPIIVSRLNDKVILGDYLYKVKENKYQSFSSTAF